MKIPPVFCNYSASLMAATFVGVLMLMTKALNTALFSGGLLLAPILAAILVAATRLQMKPA